MSASGPGCVKTRLRQGRADCFLNCLLPREVASAIGFHSDEIETEILLASSTPEFSHSLGQNRKSPRQNGTSVLPSTVDIVRPPRHVRLVPKGNITAFRSIVSWSSLNWGIAEMT